MNFQSMEYFAAVAKNRSFTRAADALHITQQTLSAHIAGIERELGCPLLIRHIPLELTYAGEVFLRYATEFNTKYDCMLHEFGDILNNQTGKLRIGIAFTRGHAIMPELIAAFQKEYPGVDVELIESSNDVLQKYLLDGTIDLAIANFSVRIPGIILRDFYEEEMVLIVSTALLQNIYGKQTEAIIQEVSRHHRYSLLAPCPFLLNREHDLVGRIGRNILATDNFVPSVHACSDNIATLLALCAMGKGACISPKNLAFSILSKEQLDTLHVFTLGKEARYPIKFACLEQSYEWNMISRFIESSLKCTH